MRARSRVLTRGFDAGAQGNKYIHLANNSIQKMNKKFKQELDIPGLMWHSDQFIEYVAQQTVRAGSNLYPLCRGEGALTIGVLP